MNRFLAAVRVVLPMLMFQNIHTTDFSTFRGHGYFFCGLGGPVVLFRLGLLPVPRFIKDRSSAAANDRPCCPQLHAL